MSDRCSVTVTAFDIKPEERDMAVGDSGVTKPVRVRCKTSKNVGGFGGYSAVSAGIEVQSTSNDKVYLRPNTLVAVNRSRLVFQPQMPCLFVIAMKYLC